ncbi:hypothetical protein V5O48_008464 [Marasmius crinis-equi]|uniref:Uncharacterized protein n=1 Tax=Marasmius crinis-equi TaxID=585013 RepID=A0ABR3FDT5_9AGAR
MAVWDSSPSDICDMAPLELTVDGSTGTCSWSFPPARCTTQSSVSDPFSEDSQVKETVFVRALWMDRSDGAIASGPPDVRFGGNEAGESDDKDDDENNGNFRGREGDTQGLFSPPGSSASYSSFSAPPGSGYSAKSYSRFDSAGLTDAISSEFNLCFSVNDFDGVNHPCHVINKFALMLISEIDSFLFEEGCIAISHDNDWISIVRDSEEPFPTKTEIIVRMCSKFKFVVEQDVIYTASLTEGEAILLQECLSPIAQTNYQGTAIKALVQFRESQVLVSVVPTPPPSTPPSTDEGESQRVRVMNEAPSQDSDVSDDAAPALSKSLMHFKAGGESTLLPCDNEAGVSPYAWHATQLPSTIPFPELCDHSSASCKSSPCWKQYPSSRFPNWTPSQALRDRIHKAIKDPISNERPCMIYAADVDDNGYISNAGERTVSADPEDADKFWGEVISEKVGLFSSEVELTLTFTTPHS